MNIIDPALPTGHASPGRAWAGRADLGPTGTEDDRDDEHPGENEAPVRETDEQTEAPEEFEIDDEDELGHPEDDDADADDDDDDGDLDDGDEDDEEAG